MSMRRSISRPAQQGSLLLTPIVANQPLRHTCKAFSSAPGKDPLSWQDYFPDPIEYWDCSLTQSSSTLEYKIIKESLGITHERCTLRSVGVVLEGAHLKQKNSENSIKKSHYFQTDILPLCKTRSNDVIRAQLLEDICKKGVIKAQLLQEENTEDLVNFRNDLGTLKTKKVPFSTDDFICILQNCKLHKDLLLAKHVHAHLRRVGLETHPVVGNHLVPALVECGSVLDAQVVFDKLGYRNVYAWTSLLIGYIQHGEQRHAMYLYDKMQEEGVPPSSYTLVALVKVCTLLREKARGRRIHIQVVQRGCESEIIVGSALIDMYSKFCSVGEAQKVFDKLSSRNVVAWSALVAAYAEFGDGQAALKCFEQMLSDGVIPNGITFISVLKACNSAGRIKKGQHIHSQIVDKGFEEELYVGNTLIDMYSKGGYVSEARDVFDKLSVRDVSSWNVMIQGYSMNHDNKSALELFESMRTLGVKPDAVTFSCILSACSRSNLLRKGQEVFRMMIKVYGIVPLADHVNCVVDLLARAGHVSEAEKLVNSSPNSPALDTCRALLNACRNFVEVEVGERCFYGGLKRHIIDGCRETMQHKHACMFS